MRVAAVTPVRAWRCHRKMIEIEAVIAQRNRIRARRQGRKMVAPGFGAGHYPTCFGELYALLPYRKRPDVLGVRRNGPVQARYQRGITGD